MYDRSGNEAEETGKRIYLCADGGVVRSAAGDDSEDFSGETVSPRYDTLQALERLFSVDAMICETNPYGVSGAHTQGSYTVEDYRALPEDQRVEMIRSGDGVYMVHRILYWK